MIEKEDEEPALLMHEVVSENTKIDCTKASTEMSSELHFREGTSLPMKAWYLDSGASNHMLGCLEHFTSLDTTTGGRVKLGDGFEVPIGGRGTVLIQGRTGEC